MANQNDFVSFATGSGANTLSASAYQALTTLLADGFQTGVAQSVQINTALRQASSIAAMIAQFGATGGPMVDNGDVAALLTSFETALTKYTGFLQQLVPNASTTVTPTSILTQVTPSQSSGSITITLAAGSISGQRVRIAGSGIGSVIVNSSVSTGSPAFALTTGAYGYTTTIPASNQAFVDFTWDGTNWRMFPSYQYAPLASPAFTGSPTAPTAGAGANNTQIANANWVNSYFAKLNGSSSEAWNAQGLILDGSVNGGNVGSALQIGNGGDSTASVVLRTDGNNTHLFPWGVPIGGKLNLFGEVSGFQLYVNGTVAGSAGTSSSEYVNVSQFDFYASGNGYQKLPSGMIIQWGNGSYPTQDISTSNFPVAFPNGVFGVVASIGTSINLTGSAAVVGAQAISNSQLQIAVSASGAGGDGVWWIAVGY